MSLAEVAFHVRHTEAFLKRALAHITPFTYSSIRHAGLELLLDTGSERAMELGFLVDGSPWDLLERDAVASETMDKQRQILRSRYRKHLSKKLADD